MSAVPIVQLEAYKLTVVYELGEEPAIWTSKTAAEIMVSDPLQVPTINKSPDFFPLPRLIMSVEQARTLGNALLKAAAIEEENRRGDAPATGTVVVESTHTPGRPEGDGPGPYSPGAA